MRDIYFGELVIEEEDDEEEGEEGEVEYFRLRRELRVEDV